MPADLVVLDSVQHRHHGWKRHDHYRFAAADHLAPLLIAELSAALPHYPLAFTRRPDGGMQLVTLQGLHEGENLYLHPATGRWNTDYIPSIYRRYPFAVHDESGDDSRLTVCFDHSSGLYREAPDPGQGEERFFAEDGTPGSLMRQLLIFLEGASKNRVFTDRAVDALEAAGLLVPWPLPLNNPDPARPLQQGLYRIDGVALDNLDGQGLKALQQANAIAVAYAQLFSLSRIGILTRLYVRKVALAENTKIPAPPESIDKLLGEADKDELKFDWSKL